MLLKQLHTKHFGNISTVISCAGSVHSSSEGMQLLARINGKYPSFYLDHNDVLSFSPSITCGRRMKCFYLFIFCSLNSQ